MKIRETGPVNQPEKPNEGQSIVPKLVNRTASESNSMEKLTAKTEDRQSSFLTGITPEKLLKDEERLLKATLNKDKINIGFISSMITSIDGN